MLLIQDTATLLKTRKQLDGLMIVLLGSREICEFEGRMLVHRTRELIMRHGKIECREHAGERMNITIFVEQAENLIAYFDALVVLSVKEKAFQVPEFVRVWFEGGHALSGS